MDPIYFRNSELDNVCDLKTKNSVYITTQTLAYGDMIDVKLVRNEDCKNIEAVEANNGMSSLDTNENVLLSNSNNELVNNSIHDSDNREDAFIIHSTTLNNNTCSLNSEQFRSQDCRHYRRRYDESTNFAFMLSNQENK
uniref:Uncharacterized protein n=1 Tax=Glossina brevipalpis TaxID=37001 RepID=A0A1A9WDH1_9MUSC